MNCKPDQRAVLTRTLGHSEHTAFLGMVFVVRTVNPHDPATRVSWMEGHDRSCDISNTTYDAAKQQEA